MGPTGSPGTDATTDTDLDLLAAATTAVLPAARPAYEDGASTHPAGLAEAVTEEIPAAHRRSRS